MLGQHHTSHKQHRRNMHGAHMVRVLATNMNGCMSPGHSGGIASTGAIFFHMGRGSCAGKSTAQLTVPGTATGTYESHRSLVMAQTRVGLEQHVNQENTPRSFIQSHELLIVAHSLTNAASLFPLFWAHSQTGVRIVSGKPAPWLCHRAPSHFSQGGFGRVKNSAKSSRARRLTMS